MSTHEELVARCARRSFAFWAANKQSPHVYEDMPISEREFALRLARDQLAEVLRTLREFTPEMTRAAFWSDVSAADFLAMLDASPLAPPKEPGK